MANTNDILEAVLKDLDFLVQSQKKQATANASTKDQQIFSSINIDEKTSKSSLNTAASLIGIINQTKNIKKSDVEHMTKTLKDIQSALTNISINKEQMEGVKNTITVLNMLNTTFGQLSQNIFSTLGKFNPVKGYLLGKGIGKFYKQLLKGFESEKLGDVIKSFSTLRNSENKDAATASVTSFASLVSAMFSVDWKQLLKISAVLSKFPDEAGKNFANFIQPIIKVISDMPDNVTTNTNDGKDSTVSANPKTASFISLIKALTSITLLDVLHLKALSKLDGEDGKKIGNFFRNIVSAANPDDAEKMVALSKMINAFSMALLAMTASLVIMVTMAAVAKPEDIACGIALTLGMIGLTYGLIKAFSGNKIEEQAKDALKTLIAISACLLLMSAIVAINTSIVKNNELTDIALGMIVTMGIIAMMHGMIKLFGSDKIAEQSNKALLSLGAMIIALIAISLMGEKFAEMGENAVDVALGATVAMGILLAGIGILWVASKVAKDPKTLGLGVLALGAVALSMGIMLIVVNKFIDLVERISAIDGSDIWIASGIIAGIFVTVTGVIFGLGALMGPGGLLFLAGVAGLAAVSISIIYMVQAISDFMDAVKITKDITKEQVGHATDIASGILTFAGEVSVLAAVLVAPLTAGAIGIGMLKSTVEGICSIVGNMIDLTNRVKELDSTGLDNAISTIVDKMVPGIQNIIDGLNKIGIIAALKVRMITSNMHPLFVTIGEFTDIITKMGSLKMIDYFDKDGKPHYKAMSNKDFSDAATTLTNAFSAFLESLSKGLEDDVIKNASVAVDLLVGKTDGSIIRSIFGIPAKGAPNFRALFKVLSSFANILKDFSSSSVEVEWDENGKCTKRVNLKEVAPDAAIALTQSFTAFIKTLSEELSGDTLKGASKIIEQLTDSDIGQMMVAISSFADAIIKFSSNKIAVEWDKNGKPIKFESLDQEKFKAAAKVLASSFIVFAQELSAGSDKIGYFGRKAIKGLADSKIDELISQISKFSDLIGPSVEKLKNIPQAPDRQDLINMANSINEIYDIIDKININKRPKMNAVDSLYKSLMTMVSGNAKIINAFNKMSAPISKLNDQIKKLDDALINKNEERLKALQGIADKFENITEALTKLNSERQKAKQLQFGSSLASLPLSMSIASLSLSDKIDELFNKFSGTQTAPQSSDDKRSSAVDTLSDIKAAIIEGMRAASNEEKTLIIKIDDGESVSTIKSQLSSI